MQSWRETRRDELFKIRFSDPALLLSMFRRVVQLDGLQALPHGATFPTMIEAILNQEATVIEPASAREPLLRM
jgi:hypothetical protein